MFTAIIFLLLLLLGVLLRFLLPLLLLTFLSVVGVGGGGTAGAQRLHGDPRSGDEAGALPGAGNERRVRSLFLLVLVLVLLPLAVFAA